MKGTLKLPIKAALCDAAGYAKTLPAPHPKFQAATATPRSKLFEPEFAPAPKKRREKRGRMVESLGVPMPPLAGGTLNRPDKSEQRTNLTFNWSPA